MDRRAFLFSIAGLSLAACTSRKNQVSIGSKNFTEQLILGEMLAQTIEHYAHLPIERRFYLAGTYICQQAILAGRVDMYVEYTGTALTAILKQPPQSNRANVFDIVKRLYRQRFNLDVLPSLGFDNSFAMVMRADEAHQYNLRTLSDLAAVAPHMRMGVGYEFLERPDGYQGLVKTYGLRFAEPPRVMDLGLLYRALEARQVDIVAGSNTDGLIAALGCVVLEDDKHYFPPYEAVPIVRPQTLQLHPQVRTALNALTGRITAEDMRHLNYAVDGEKKDAAQVVAEFLRQRNLLT
ncbi:MAG: glycine betaine ABC transporter substrate-binding protein [Terriglobia bacterium]|jgi:osmoprotectant transport system substrate-binding protein|nr:glycine betaine ABC transporter substrate-binding protein [Terriglobia bacterium]